MNKEIITDDGVTLDAGDIVMTFLPLMGETMHEEIAKIINENLSDHFKEALLVMGPMGCLYTISKLLNWTNNGGKNYVKRMD